MYSILDTGYLQYLHLMDSLSGDLNYFNDPSINKTFLH